MIRATGCDGTETAPAITLTRGVRYLMGVIDGADVVLEPLRETHYRCGSDAV